MRQSTLMPYQPDHDPQQCSDLRPATPKIHSDESRPQGPDRLELIRFLQVPEPSPSTTEPGPPARHQGAAGLRGRAVRIEDYQETLRGHRVLHLVGKRLVWAATTVFHLINGRDLAHTVDEAEALMLAAAAGSLDVPEIATWLRHHLEGAS